MFKDTKEGTTHYQNDGCGEPAHNNPILKAQCVAYTNYKNRYANEGYTFFCEDCSYTETGCDYHKALVRSGFTLTRKEFEERKRRKFRLN